jgi:hypothetical protein
MRKFLAFILLGVLTLVGAGGAALGAVQSSSATAIGQAVKNTLKAPNYTEDLTEKTPQGNQQAHLVFQSPDRLAGWLVSSGRKTWLFIVGSTEYVAVTGAASTSTPTTFFTQQTQGAVAVDPAHTYVPYCTRKPSTLSGSVTTVTLTQGGETEKLTCTVSGNYVSNFKAVTPGGTIELAISSVGSSPAVELPHGYRTTKTPPAQG